MFGPVTNRFVAVSSSVANKVVFGTKILLMLLLNSFDFIFYIFNFNPGCYILYSLKNGFLIQSPFKSISCIIIGLHILPSGPNFYLLAIANDYRQSSSANILTVGYHKFLF